MASNQKRGTRHAMLTKKADIHYTRQNFLKIILSVLQPDCNYFLLKVLGTTESNTGPPENVKAHFAHVSVPGSTQKKIPLLLPQQ